MHAFFLRYELQVMSYFAGAHHIYLLAFLVLSASIQLRSWMLS
jgi:hypothetical protein